MSARSASASGCHSSLMRLAGLLRRHPIDDGASPAHHGIVRHGRARIVQRRLDAATDPLVMARLSLELALDIGAHEVADDLGCGAIRQLSRGLERRLEISGNPKVEILLLRIAAC